MSNEPIQLEYSNPIDDQPPGSDAVAEYGTDTLTIAIPPQGWMPNLAFFVLAIILCFSAFTLAAALMDSRPPNRLGSLAGIVVLALFAVGSLIEGVAAASHPTLVKATFRKLELTRPSWLKRHYVFDNARSADLQVTFGSPSLSLRGLTLIADLRIAGKSGIKWSLIRQRDKTELQWMKRQLGKVLDGGGQ